MCVCKISPKNGSKEQKGTAGGNKTKKESEEMERGVMQDGKDALVRNQTCVKIP